MKRIAAVLTALFVVACASPPKAGTSNQVKPIVSSAATTDTAPDTQRVSIATVTSSALDTNAKIAESIAHEPIEHAPATLDKSVYFDFDSFSVLPEYRDVVIHQVEFIKNHQNEFVVLEGNADERGSSEYDLALGDKRAQAVRNSLVLLGIPSSRIRVVSLGKEQPRLTCHEEKCWHENRRVDFLIKHS
jgi:peptidoglycan-associated lipoprotein